MLPFIANWNPTPNPASLHAERAPPPSVLPKRRPPRVVRQLLRSGWERHPVGDNSILWAIHMAVPPNAS